MIFAVLGLFCGPCSSLPDFKGGDFYRFSRADGLILEMEFILSTCPTTNISLRIPGAMVDSPSIITLCEKIELDLKPNENGKFTYNLPFSTDPCLREIQAHVLMKFDQVISDEVLIIFDPETDSFTVKTEIPAVLQKSIKTDLPGLALTRLIVDDDGEEDRESELNLGFFI
jgi:hypothetical protein